MRSLKSEYWDLIILGASAVGIIIYVLTVAIYNFALLFSLVSPSWFTSLEALFVALTLILVYGICAIIYLVHISTNAYNELRPKEKKRVDSFLYKLGLSILSKLKRRKDRVGKITKIITEASK